MGQEYELLVMLIDEIQKAIFKNENDKGSLIQQLEELQQELEYYRATGKLRKRRTQVISCKGIVITRIIYKEEFKNIQQIKY